MHLLFPTLDLKLNDRRDAEQKRAEKQTSDHKSRLWELRKPYKLRHAAMAAIGAIAVRAKAAADAQKRPREEEE